MTTRIKGPTVVCDECQQDMHHEGGVTFRCQKGHEWTPDWNVIEVMDEAMAEFSQKGNNGMLLADVERLALCGSDETLQERIDALWLRIKPSQRMFVAWATWRKQLDDAWDSI